MLVRLKIEKHTHTRARARTHSLKANSVSDHQEIYAFCKKNNIYDGVHKRQQENSFWC
jgi:hypothetical protein